LVAVAKSYHATPLGQRLCWQSEDGNQGEQEKKNVNKHHTKHKAQDSFATTNNTIKQIIFFFT
jgi:hypothetical protein